MIALPHNYLIGNERTGWLPVPRGNMISHDMENFPLYLKTDSVVGSGEIVKVRFFDANEKLAGRVFLFFTSPPKVYLYLCQYHTINLPSEEPSDKIIKITLTKTSSSRLEIYCDDVEVFNILLSDETCGASRWNDFWGRTAKNVVFEEKDTATDFYSLTKPLPTGTNN